MPSKRRHNKRNISQLQDKMLSVNNRQTYRRTNLRIQLIIKHVLYVKTMDNRNNKKKGCLFQSVHQFTFLMNRKQPADFTWSRDSSSVVSLVT